MISASEINVHRDERDALKLQQPKLSSEQNKLNFNQHNDLIRQKK
jgi:hypothetical protein